MERCTTRDEFCQALQAMTETLATEIWTTLVEGSGADADAWLRRAGGEWLRGVLGVALTARATALGVSGRCGCGGWLQFRQQRPVRVHTVLPGRDVDTTVAYGQCAQCRQGVWPVLRELGVDAEGFTPALQGLGILAAVVEPYETASHELLERMAGVSVSTEKLQAWVRDEGARATQQLMAAPARSEEHTSELQSQR